MKLKQTLCKTLEHFNHERTFIHTFKKYIEITFCICNLCLVTMKNKVATNSPIQSSFKQITSRLLINQIFLLPIIFRCFHWLGRFTIFFKRKHQVHCKKVGKYLSRFKPNGHIQIPYNKVLPLALFILNTCNRI